MAKKKILIIDDSTDTRLVVSARLATWPRVGATSYYGTVAKQRLKRFVCVEGDRG